MKKDTPKKPLKRDSVKTLEYNFKGISLTQNKKKFRAIVHIKNRRFDLGVFNTEKQAIAAYSRAEREYRRIFGEK